MDTARRRKTIDNVTITSKKTPAMKYAANIPANGQRRLSPADLYGH
ncbi:MAG: hypothetical protein NC230_07165 [Bacteroides sp.]|nr:hypothetical protein [Bacteroides sp.]MCM1413901.1 hypothetical protein [Bacteroides sp.]